MFARETINSGRRTWRVKCLERASWVGEYWIFLGVCSNPATYVGHPSTCQTLYGISISNNLNEWTCRGAVGCRYGDPKGAKMEPNDTIVVTLDCEARTLTYTNPRLGWTYVLPELTSNSVWTPFFDPYDCSFVLTDG